MARVQRMRSREEIQADVRRDKGYGQGVTPGYGYRGRRRELVVSAARAWRCVTARRGELRAAWCGARQARAGVSRAWSWLADRLNS